MHACYYPIDNLNIPASNTRLLSAVNCLFWLLLLMGCGTDDNVIPAADIAERVISGNVSKGPLGGAIIRLYNINNRGQREGSILAETVTDDAGNWSITLAGVPADAPAYLLVESSGGVYVDEADPAPNPSDRRRVQLAAGEKFSTLLTSTDGTVALNIFTDALFRKSRHETQGEEFFQVYELNRSFINTAFGFDVTAIQPADPVTPAVGSSVQSRTYAMALGGVANAVNTLAVANQLVIANFEIISTLIEDLTDCNIDGRSVSGELQNISTVTLDLNTEILRFRNNNFNAYLGTPLLEVDQDECARSGRIADTIAPVFQGVPENLVFEAADQQGVSSTETRVLNRLGSIQATDDRDGTVSYVTNLPGTLPIGLTTVTLTAADIAGNTSVVEFSITIVAPEAPTIVAPSDVVARGKGELTQVDLGTPQFSDNVSAQEQLLVTNDAPRDGFSVGQHLVTWMVTDEVGLQASDVQRVYVDFNPGDDENVISPDGSDYTQLPILLSPGEFPIAPVTRPGPVMTNTVRLAVSALDTDGDGIPDHQEIAFGTNIFEPDSDHDGISDGIEVQLSGDPLQPSRVIYIPVSGRLDTRRLSLPDGTVGPVFVVLQPGIHYSPIELTAPCDHVTLIGNMDVTGEPAGRAQISTGFGVGLTIRGCQDVQLFRIDFSDNYQGALRLIGSQVTIYESVLTHNTVTTGSAIETGPESQLRLIDSYLDHNNSASFGSSHTSQPTRVETPVDPSVIVIPTPTE